MMLDEEDFDKVRGELSEFNEIWVELNNKSRLLIKKTKQLIYALHRENTSEAKTFKVELDGLRTQLFDACKRPKLKYSGPVRIALQEYVEAVCYLSVITDGKLPGMRDLDVSAETYLLGLCDLTGELMRKCIYYMIKEDFDKAKILRDVVAEIYEAVLSCDLPSGEIRKKSDSIKYNLSKMEQVLFEAKIRDKI